MENCLDPKNGISKATAFSIYFALSFEKYNETVPHQWIDEAEKILKDFQEESVYWNVRIMGILSYHRPISCRITVYPMKLREVLFKQ